MALGGVPVEHAGGVLAEPDAAQITGTPATVLALFAMFDRFNLMFDVIAPPPSLRTK